MQQLPMVACLRDWEGHLATLAQQELDAWLTMSDNR